MVRDFTMIFSVMVSIISLGFAVYKNIEAGNARGFAYEQTYRLMAIVNQSAISTSAKNDIFHSGFSSLGTPEPVINFSDSSASAPADETCSEYVKAQCISAARQIADFNAICEKGNGAVDACAQANALQTSSLVQSCIPCFIN